VVIVLVSSWCERRRGLSIGIALLGTSLGSAFLPVANAFLIAHYDWRFAMQVDAILPIIGAVVVFLTVRGLPRHSATATSTVPDPEAGFAFMEAIRTRAFWAIAASGFLTYAAIFGFVQHLVLHMTKGLGYTLPQAAQALLWYSFLAMIAKLTSGALADRMDRHKVFLSCLVVMFVGTLLLATMRRDLLMASVVAIALGWGGLFTLYNMLAVSNFGLREIGRIIGSIIFFENLGIGIGSWLTGRIYDYFGSYQIAFIVIVMMLVLGLVVGSQTRLRSPTAAGTT
jgi:MFS family permease